MARAFYSLTKASLVFALAFGLHSYAVSAATLVDFSIARSVSADAQAGGATIQTVSGSAMGSFNEKRTDTDASTEGTATVTAFQNTSLSLANDGFELRGAAYTRAIADGAAIAAFGRSEVSIFFTITEQFNFFMSGTGFTSATLFGENLSNGVSVTLGQITNGNESFAYSLGFGVVGGGTRSDFRSARLSPGRYHLTLTVQNGLSFSEFVPQGRDLTSSIYDFAFILSPVPEPSAAVLVAIGSVAIGLRRVRSGRSARSAP